MLDADETFHETWARSQLVLNGQQLHVISLQLKLLPLILLILGGRGIHIFKQKQHLVSTESAFLSSLQGSELDVEKRRDKKWTKKVEKVQNSKVGAENATFWMHEWKWKSTKQQTNHAAWCFIKLFSSTLSWEWCDIIYLGCHTTLLVCCLTAAHYRWSCHLQLNFVFDLVKGLDQQKSFFDESLGMIKYLHMTVVPRAEYKSKQREGQAGRNYFIGQGCFTVQQPVEYQMVYRPFHRNVMSEFISTDLAIKLQPFSFSAFVGRVLFIQVIKR